MGWFGYYPLSGDIGLDFKDELFDFLDIDTENFDFYEIHNKLEQNEQKVLDFVKNYNWDKFDNPGLIQFFYIQALFQIYVDFQVPISDRFYKEVHFLDNDPWAKNNALRRKALDKIKSKIIRRENV